MEGFLVMLKTNIKLLLRNKGYIICIFLIPIIAVLIMNSNSTTFKEGIEKNNEILEWKSVGDTFDIENIKMTVKVYDYSESAESSYLLQKLAQTSTYRLYLVNNNKVSREDKESYDDIIKGAKKLFESSTIRAILYISKDFTESIIKGEEPSVKIIKGYDDSRIDLLQNNIEWYCSEIEYAYHDALENGEKLETVINKMTQEEMIKNVVLVKDEDSVALTEKQQQQRSKIGYALCFLTVSFIFSGVFIASILIKEKENKSINRMKLSLTSNQCYIMVKLCLILLTAIIETLVFGIGIALVMGTKIGVPYGAFLVMILLQGILFNSLSLVIGTLINNLFGTTFLSFTIWSISNLLGGLFFPIVQGSAMEKMSMFAPQRWLIKTSEMYMMGKEGAFTQYILIFLAFMIVLFTISMIGLKIYDKE